MQAKFIEAIKNHQHSFEINLSDDEISKLFDYYELVLKHNDFLHLVAPCDAEEFAVRHILESLLALNFLPQNSTFADIGAGAGLPSIPCLIVREDLFGNLIESKLKKGKFLNKVLQKCKLENRASLLNRQFEELKKPTNVLYVLCRALDKFTKKLPKILKWSEGSSLMLFGGNSLREALEKQNVEFEEKLIPMSERRFIFTVNVFPK